MNINQLANEITEKLRGFGRGSKQAHRPSAQEDFGVYSPDMRSVVREYRKKLKSQSGDDIYALALALIAMNVTECRQVAYELIYGHSEARGSLNRSQVEALGKGLDNWACVDTFCSNVAGPAWREGTIADSVVFRWVRSKDLWWRRVAVVCTVALNTKSRGGTGDSERTIRVCDLLVEDEEIMVQKAISWGLRALVPWDREEVERFIKQHEDVLSALVVREVKRKLNTGKKN